MKIIVNLFILSLILSSCGRYQKQLWVGEKKDKKSRKNEGKITEKDKKVDDFDIHNIDFNES